RWLATGILSGAVHLVVFGNPADGSGSVDFAHRRGGVKDRLHGWGAGGDQGRTSGFTRPGPRLGISDGVALSRPWLVSSTVRGTAQGGVHASLTCHFLQRTLRAKLRGSTPWYDRVYQA